MSFFIKPGFWEERKLAPKHWLNLNTLVTGIVYSLIPGIPTIQEVLTAGHIAVGRIIEFSESINNVVTRIGGPTFTIQTTDLDPDVNQLTPYYWVLRKTGGTDVLQGNPDGISYSAPANKRTYIKFEIPTGDGTILFPDVVSRTTKVATIDVTNDYINDTAAGIAGIPVGQLYHTSGIVKIRLV